MKIISPKVEILQNINAVEILKHIELCGRTCYKSEHKITDISHTPFIRSLIKSGHESVLEHVDITVKFTTNRATSHEIVRHRIASYSQESTRYTKYSDIELVPSTEILLNTKLYDIWFKVMLEVECAYSKLLDECGSADIARSVLTNDTKTEIVMTANIREWRHFIGLRGSRYAHVDIRNLALKLKELLIDYGLDVLVEDIHG